MNRAFAAIAVGLSLCLVAAAASAVGAATSTPEIDQRAQDCSSVAQFYALMLQGEKAIAQGSEADGESLFIRAKRLPLNERQRSIQRYIRSSITPPDESYLRIYRTCWDGYWNLTAHSNRHDALPGPNGATLNAEACQCPVETLCDSESPNFDS
ncbi:MAG: hypothetical protein V3U43_05620 [Pseudomonadales bacterium]